jgi:thiol-disulfide isomerase/thioredoxin
MTRALLAVLVIGVACGHPTASPSKPVAEPEKSTQLNAPGAIVDIEKSLVPGYVTVVDFWAESCGACHVVGGMLAVGVAQEPKVLIRKVDVGDTDTPVAEAYKIGALPHYRVYDKRGKMRYLLVGNDCIKAPEIAKQLVAEP